MNAARFSFASRDGRPLSAYENLCSLLADAQPQYGYVHESDLRPLTDDEVAVVCCEKAQDIDDALKIDVEQLCGYLSSPLVLANLVATALSKAAHRVAYLDTQDECARRDEARKWERV